MKVDMPLNKETGFNVVIDIQKVSKVGNHSRGRLEGSLFNSYYTEAYGRALLLSLDCSTLPLICTLYCWVLSKEVSSTIFKVFGMTRPRIETRSPSPLANTLPTIQKVTWVKILFMHVTFKIWYLKYFQYENEPMDRQHFLCMCSHTCLARIWNLSGFL